MAAILFTLPLPGTPTGLNFSLEFFIAGTSTPQDVFTDSDLNTAWSQPIVFNSDGMTDGPIYLTPTPALKVFLKDENGVDVNGYPCDFVSPAAVAS